MAPLFFFRFRTYPDAELPADGNQNAKRSGSSTSLPEDLWKYRQPGYPHELQMTPRSVTRTNTLERNIVFTSGLCWKCCKIRIRSTCPVCPWMYGFFSFLAYVYRIPWHQQFLPAPRQSVLAYLECENIVGEHNHFVSPVLVVLDKELTRLELSWIHAVKQHAFT